ncbi:Fc receptor-like protein 2 [Ranitomeya variabilis]|uniref:Fc receptor-like protein 2 n=1 Tax=Ranitomeya variabilis TaxID=490064 RepID=UPI0040570556
MEILEGDSLTLRCHSRSEYKVVSTIFYKDNKEIKTSESDSQLHIDKVEGAVNGKYKCMKTLQDYDGTFHSLSDETYVSMSELFSHPKLKPPPYSIVEDDDLTCVKRLNPLRDGKEIKFAFYREGQKVQEFSSSDTYRVPSVQSEDPGNYTCEVMTPTIRKMSDVSYVHVQELFSFPEIKVPLHRILWHELTITSVTRLNPLRCGKELQITFYRNGQKVQQLRSLGTYTIQSARLEDSGNYTCAWRRCLVLQ